MNDVIVLTSKKIVKLVNVIVESVELRFSRKATKIRVLCQRKTVRFCQIFIVFLKIMNFDMRHKAGLSQEKYGLKTCLRTFSDVLF